MQHTKRAVVTASRCSRARARRLRRRRTHRRRPREPRPARPSDGDVTLDVHLVDPRHRGRRRGLERGEPRHPGQGPDRPERQRRHVPELLQPAQGRQRARPRPDRVRRAAELPRAGRPRGPRRVRGHRRRRGPVRPVDLGPGHPRHRTASTACRRTPAPWPCSTAPTCSSRTASRFPRRGRSTRPPPSKVRAAGGYITNFSQSRHQPVRRVRLAGRRRLVHQRRRASGPST